VADGAAVCEREINGLAEPARIPSLRNVLRSRALQEGGCVSVLAFMSAG